jgi:hypothetical protein
MEKTIRLCYRKIIDVNSVKPWEKLVFNDTYTEFLMQAQLYNQGKKYTSFSELINNVPGSDKLHFLVSAAAINYIKQLGGKIPDVQNTLGLTFLLFNNFRFEIINSDIRDKSNHVVAINFYSDPLTWHSTIGNQLLLSSGKEENGELLTDMLIMQPFVSIYAIK